MKNIHLTKVFSLGVFVCVFAGVAGCDALVNLSKNQDEVRINTKGTDVVLEMLELGSGDILVGGMAEGVIAPADGTLPTPMIARINREKGVLWTKVYRTEKYGTVIALAENGEDLLAWVSSSDDRAPSMAKLALWRLSQTGTLKEVLFERVESSLSARVALLTNQKWLVVSDVYQSTGCQQTFQILSLQGRPYFTHQENQCLDIRVLGETSAGGFWAIYNGTASTYEAWKKTWSTAAQPLKTEKISLPAGLYGIYAGVSVQESAYLISNASHPYAAHLLRQTGEEGVSTQKTWLLEDRTYISLLAADQRGAWVAQNHYSEGFASRMQLTWLPQDGSTGWTRAIQTEANKNVSLDRLLRLKNGQLLVAGTTIDPEKIGGFGGDDTEVFIRWLAP